MANNVAALRAQVLKSQRLAVSKMNRIQKSEGAQVRGSQFDPTRDPAKVARYNSKQLRAYNAELEAFRARNVQFVGGAAGKPIPRAMWNRYKGVQDTYNRVSGREFEQIARVKLPGGQSIGDRELTFLPEARSAAGRASNRPRGAVTLQSWQIAGADAIPALEKRLRSRMSETHYRRTLKRQRWELGELLSKGGMADLSAEIPKMSDAQFNTLWNYTDFPEFMSTHYESVKNMNTADEAKVSDDHRNEVASTLKWAQRIK